MSSPPVPTGDPDNTGFYPPPPGIEPNFKNPTYNSGGIYPISGVFLALATFFLVLRIYTKAHIVKVFGWEDVTIVAAWIFNVANTTLALVQQNYGNGIHEWNISRSHWDTYFKNATASYVIYVPAVGLSKVAILLFYLRLNPQKQFRYAVYFLLLIVWSWMTAIILATIFQCQPLNKLWQPLVDGKCPITGRLFLANSVLNVITDFFVLLVPIPMIVRLQVSTRQKMVVSSLFALGSLTCILSVIRCYYVSVLLNNPADATWKVVTSTSLVVAETNLGVICGCLMVFRPFLRRHFPFLLGDYSRYKKAGPQGTYDGPSGPNSRSEYKAKVTTSSSNSRSAGRSWFKHSTKGGESDDEMITPNEDVELGVWPKNHRTAERPAEGRTVGHNENGVHMAFGNHPGGDGIMKTVAVRVK